MIVEENEQKIKIPKVWQDCATTSWFYEVSFPNFYNHVNHSGLDNSTKILLLAWR